MGRYDGKTAVITGGSSGIGLATARLLVDEGARVMITGRTEETLTGAVRELGAQASYFRGDVGSTEDSERLLGQARDALGTIDLLFLNAGVTRWRSFEQTDEQTWDEVLTVNTRGPYFLVQKLLPLLDGGSIVFTTAVVDQKGFPLVSAYAASKAALRSLTRSLARELIPQNIRVNAVSPGAVATDILAKVVGADAADKAMSDIAAGNPMQRVAQPDEVARAVAFLAFDATYTTGAEFAVDGGASTL